MYAPQDAAQVRTFCVAKQISLAAGGLTCVRVNLEARLYCGNTFLCLYGGFIRWTNLVYMDDYATFVVVKSGSPSYDPTTYNKRSTRVCTDLRSDIHFLFGLLYRDNFNTCLPVTWTAGRVAGSAKEGVHTLSDASYSSILGGRSFPDMFRSVVPVPFSEGLTKFRRLPPDDWVCSACGNSNFGFRTSCNMRKCGAPKPLAGGPSLKGAEPYSVQGGGPPGGGAPGGGAQGGGYKSQGGGFQGGGSRLPGGAPSDNYGGGYAGYAGYAGYGGGMDGGLGAMNMGMGMGGMGYGMEGTLAPMPALGGMGMGGMGMGAMGGYGGAMGGYGGAMGGYGAAMPQAYGAGYGGAMPNARDSDSRKRRGGEALL
eukprot:1185291-Prorocentrum_minimum.AAC.3